jgi:hypothetical protein
MLKKRNPIADGSQTLGGHAVDVDGHASSVGDTGQEGVCHLSRAPVTTVVLKQCKDGFGFLKMI